MKGSKKQLARYLESEYNDEYLEALDDNESLNMDKISEQLQKCTPTRPNAAETTKNALSDNQKPQAVLAQAKLDNPKSTNTATLVSDPFTISLKPQHNMPNVDLKIRKIEELARKLGQDAQNCASYLTEAQHLQNKGVLQALDKFYQKFETIPVLFLSIVPNQAVYAWQINRLCPVTRESRNTDLSEYTLIEDSKNLDHQVVLHMSFLLLGKIVPKEGEEILGAQFLEDEQLCVRSKTEDNELVIRFYHIADFSKHATVNPVNEEVLVNDRHFYEVRMKRVEGQDETTESLEVLAWSKKEEEQKLMIIQMPIYGNLSKQFIVHENTFSEIYIGLSGITALIDEASSIVVACKGIEISILNYGVSFFHFAARVEKSLIMKSQNYHKINFEAFPEIVIDEMGDKLEKDLMDKLEKSKQEKYMKTQQKLCITTNRVYDPRYQILVYTNNIIVRNPYQRETLAQPEPKKQAQVKGEQANQEEQKEEVEKESLAQRVDKMKKKFESAGDDRLEIQEKKELLREIRADIGENMKQVAEFEKKYTENEKLGYYNIKLVEPSGVAKESLELYEKIKEEKRMLQKKREKEKDQAKKEGSFKNEI